MEKKITFLYTIVSIVFFLLALIFALFRIVGSRSDLVDERQELFARFERQLASSYISGGGIDSEQFRGTARDFMRNNPACRVLLLYSYDNGLLYFLPRNPETYDASSLDFQGKNVPQLSYRFPVEEKISSLFQVPDRKGLVIEGLFTVLETRTVFPILRDTLIAFSAYFLITCILLVVTGILGTREKGELLPGEPPAEDRYDSVAADPVSHPEPPRSSFDSEKPMLFKENIPEYRPEKQAEDFSIDTDDLDAPAFEEFEPVLETGTGDSRELSQFEQPVSPGYKPVAEPATSPEEPVRKPADAPRMAEPDTGPKKRTAVSRAFPGEQDLKPAEVEVPAGAPETPAGKSAVPAAEEDLAPVREQPGLWSGKAWPEIEEFLTESDSGGYEVVLALISFSSPRDAITMRRMHALIETAFQDVGAILEHGEYRYIVLLKNTDLDEAIRETEKLYGHIRYESEGTLRAGLTVKNGRIVSGILFLKEAEQALARTRDERGERIIGFRPDPGKYRSVVAGT